MGEGVEGLSPREDEPKRRMNSSGIGRVTAIALRMLSPVFVVICMLATVAAVLNAASVALQTGSPEVSLKLNPLNAEARVNLAYARLEAEEEAPEPETIDIINAGIVLSPIDARFYSLMGLTAEQTDDPENARLLYRHALKVLPTEIMALSNTMGMAFQAGDVATTIDQLEIIGRRWGYWPAIEAMLPELLQDQFALSAVKQRFSNDKVLRTQLINALTASSEGLIYVSPLLLDWHKRKVPGLEPLVNQVTSLLVSEDLGPEAYALFKDTLAAETKTNGNLLHNGDLRKPVRGNRFDWQVRSQAGVDYDFIGHGSVKAGKDDNDATPKVPLAQRGVAVRFLGTPVRSGSVSQLIGLPAGGYKLSVAYSATRLRVPKPLVLNVTCLEGRKSLGQFVFEGEEVPATEAKISFEVPKTDCSMQNVSVSIQSTPNSWRKSYRYSGTLFLNRIAIMPAGS